MSSPTKSVKLLKFSIDFLCGIILLSSTNNISFAGSFVDSSTLQHQLQSYLYTHNHPLFHEAAKLITFVTDAPIENPFQDANRSTATNQSVVYSFRDSEIGTTRAPLEEIGTPLDINSAATGILPNSALQRKQITLSGIDLDQRSSLYLTFYNRYQLKYPFYV